MLGFVQANYSITDCSSDIGKTVRVIDSIWKKKAIKIDCFVGSVADGTITVLQEQKQNQLDKHIKMCNYF